MTIAKLPSRGTLDVLQRINAKRGPREYLKVLEQLTAEIDELVMLSNAHMRVISATTFTFDSGDLTKHSPKGDAGKNSDKVKVKRPADIAKLEKHYKASIELTRKLKELDLLEADFEMNFGQGDNNGLGLQAMTRKINTMVQEMRKRVLMNLESAYSMMNKMGKDKLPKRFQSLCDKLSTTLSTALAYESVMTQLYIYPSEGSLASTQYFMLSNMEDDDGRLFPRYFVVLTGSERDQADEADVGLPPRPRQGLQQHRPHPAEQAAR